MAPKGTEIEANLCMRARISSKKVSPTRSGTLQGLAPTSSDSGCKIVENGSSQLDNACSTVPYGCVSNGDIIASMTQAYCRLDVPSEHNSAGRKCMDTQPMNKPGLPAH